MNHILVILSSETELPLKDGRTHTTGFYLNEFGVPAQRLVQEGYTLTVATPKGNRPAMDPGSDIKDFFRDEAEHRQIRAFVTGLLDEGVVKLSDVAGDLGQFSAVFLPGGHAPMIELMRDADLARVLEHFHARSLPTALICHAPAALLAAQPGAAEYQDALQRGETPASKGFLYDGYKVTVFANAEEQDAEKGFEAPMQYYPADALNAAGALVVNGEKYTSHVVRDRELITGQNPMSDEEFVEVFLKALREQAAQA